MTPEEANHKLFAAAVGDRLRDLRNAREALEGGADVNARNNDGQTPLHLAHDIDVAKWLMDNGANVNAKDNSGQTPLHRTSKYQHWDVSPLLIKNGADVNARDNYGATPLHLATECFVGGVDYALLLIKNGADVNVKDNYRKTPRDWATIYNNTSVAEMLNETMKAKAADRQTPELGADDKSHAPAV
jgi:ankyrin repeat protein